MTSKGALFLLSLSSVRRLAPGLGPEDQPAPARMGGVGLGGGRGAPSNSIDSHNFVPLFSVLGRS